MSLMLRIRKMLRIALALEIMPRAANDNFIRVKRRPF